MSIMEILMRRQDYAKEVRQINSSEGYFTRFYQLVGDCNIHKEAWKKLEEERIDLGLEEKYSTYNSFRKAKKAYMDIKFI